jgi:hypothetical protein
MRYDTLTEIADAVADSTERVKGIRKVHPSLSGDIAADLHSAVTALERAQKKLDGQLGERYRQERPRQAEQPE